MRRKEGERAVIYERNRGRRDTRRRPPQSGAHATWGQNQRRGTGDTLQLRDLTRGRKEMAIALGRNANGGGGVGRVYWPRIRTVYLVRRLVCSLTPIRRREKRGRIQKGEEKRSAVVFVVSLHAARDATTLCRRRQQHNGGGREGEGERYQKERISKGRSLMNE